LPADDEPAAAATRPGSALAEAEEVERSGRVVAAERQTLFSDAVIAIAITLLALDLPDLEGRTNADLLHAAFHDRGSYLAFLISFVVIWGHWAGHHRTFRYVTEFDGRLSVLNTLWLFTQVITPYATTVISGDDAFQVRFGFYALVQAAASLLFAAMLLHLRRAGLFRSGTPMRAFDRGLVRTWSLAAGFLLSIPLSFLTEYSWVTWIALPVLTGRVVDLIRRRR
jgi:uncharacterized membrane protein